MLVHIKIIDQGFPIKMAVGDFDSLSEEDFKRITCPIERHPIMKDETDSELAIRLCKDYDTIHLYGGMQGKNRSYDCEYSLGDVSFSKCSVNR